MVKKIRKLTRCNGSFDALDDGQLFHAILNAGIVILSVGFGRVHGLISTNKQLPEIK